MYGLHTLPLKDELLRKNDTFHLKGLRQILGLRTTYVERANTHQRVLGIAEESINRKEGNDKQTKGKTIKLMSTLIKEKSIEELGEIIRLPREDPRRQVTLEEEGAKPNLPPVNRIGRPRAQWTLIAMERAWNTVKLDETSEETKGQSMNINNQKHFDIILDAAESHML